MWCIFCKTRTDGERAREHIIPESLGNFRHILPAGYVCTACNNYFSREIEGPLLSHPSFRNLRARFQIPTKKGRIPFLHGFLAETDFEVGMRLSRAGGVEIRAERDRDSDEIYKRLFEKTDNLPLVAFSFDMHPPSRQMSRLMAKMALETVARRLSSSSDSLERFIFEEHYDIIRRWTRHGDNLKEWPYYQRSVHPEETYMRHPETGNWVRAGFSHDLFFTKRRETYFAFCLYGHEFVINVGGPSIAGYEEWLVDHGNISPVIERVGFQLRQGLACGMYYLEGDPTVRNGAAFDKKLRVHWPD